MAIDIKNGERKNQLRNFLFRKGNYILSVKTERGSKAAADDVNSNGVGKYRGKIQG